MAVSARVNLGAPSCKKNGYNILKNIPAEYTIDKPNVILKNIGSFNKFRSNIVTNRCHNVGFAKKNKVLIRKKQILKIIGRKIIYLYHYLLMFVY